MHTALCFSLLPAVGHSEGLDLPYLKKPGLQLYTVRAALSKAPAETLKTIAEIGYKMVEVCDFPHSIPLIKEARNQGLEVYSGHFDWSSILGTREDPMGKFRQVLDQAREHSLSHLVIPYLSEEFRKSLDDYKKHAALANEAAAISRQAGIQLCYHNHGFEFRPLEGGKTGFDVMMAEFGSEMKFELDVFWAKVGGHEPCELISKLSSRVGQLHLKDLKADLPLPNYGSVPGDAFKELGNGVISMLPILESAKKVGVAYCYVEQDSSPDPMASIRQSAAFLAKLCG
jgi:sugar phosphate isomerase/epimerase